MKIAILFEANLYDRKGLLNAIINRTKNLMAVSNSTIDLYCMQDTPGGLNKCIRKRHVKTIENIYQLDGLRINIMWYKNYLVDDIINHRFHIPPPLFRIWAKRNIKVFSSYDLISAHSLRSGEVANLIYKRYKIPYCVTWHGTDIHTTPFLSSSLKHYVTNILEGAECNFFVSEALRKKAKSFANNFYSDILYNGVSEKFVRYESVKRMDLREKYHVGENKVVAFVGNLVPVKNVKSLPLIFKEVKQKYSNHISFWIIGDGYQRDLVEKGMMELDIECSFWGNRTIHEMPDFMNCIDVLVLPSVNEGLPLVTLEALACGSNVVGSKVGGIPEVIGEDNTFELGNDFVSNISTKIAYYLTHNEKQIIQKKFSWKETAIKEDRIYNEIFKRYRL